MRDQNVTAASAALRRAVSPSTMSQSEVAEKLGVSQQAVCAWVAGTSKPSLARMIKLRELLGIAVEDWAAPPPPTSGTTLPADVDDPRDGTNDT